MRKFYYNGKSTYLIETKKGPYPKFHINQIGFYITQLTLTMVPYHVLASVLPGVPILFLIFYSPNRTNLF